MSTAASALWPRLREELTVEEGPRLYDGQPSWTLHDPSRHRFFRLDWLTFEILQRWSLADPDKIAQQVSQRTSLKPEAADVVSTLEFLQQNQLLHLSGTGASEGWADLVEARRKNWWQWLVSNYLFFRIPLIDPSALLRTLHQIFGFVFRPAFWWATGIAFLLGISNVWRQWDAFAATLLDLREPGRWLGYLVVLIGVKCLHELGHGLAAAHYGLRTPAMGVAFMILMPLAYTDTTDAWRLKRRRPRLLIGAAGILTELMIAVWATLAWSLLPDGATRDAAFALATVSWIKSLVINLSPVMRFDGYYLLSDALDIPNLHSRCFALARWRLREWLFGLGEPAPESFEPGMRRGLVVLGFGIWIYRFLLFLGIAVLVYSLFFKLLGVVLFVVEIVSFILLPIWREVKHWYQRRVALWQTRRTRLTALGFAALALLLAIPLPQRANLSARLHPQREWVLSAPEVAELRSLAFSNGDRVDEGAPLFELESEALAWRLARAALREQALQAELSVARADSSLRNRIPVLEAQIATAHAAGREAASAVERLSRAAPSQGIVRLADPDLAPGITLRKDEAIAILYDPSIWIVEGYLNERQRALVEVGMEARFFSEGDAGPAYRLVVQSIDRDATRELSDPILATVHGGSISARLVDGTLRPEGAVYRVVLAFVDGAGPDERERAQRGEVVIHAASESIGLGWLRRAAALLWRELGF